MGDVAQMYAIAEVYGTDLPRVRTGQRAVITNPALTRALSGTVEVVGRAISRNQVIDVDPAAAGLAFPILLVFVPRRDRRTACLRGGGGVSFLHADLANRAR